MKNCVLVFFFVILTYATLAQDNDLKSEFLTLKLKLVSNIDTVKNRKYTTFKYTITNNSNKEIYFNTLSLSDYFVDTMGENIPSVFFSLKLEKLKEDNAVSPCADPHGVDFPVPWLTKQDTLKHIVKIRPGKTYSSLLKMYACFDLSLEEEGIAHYYVRKYSREKHVKFQLLYNNTKLKSDTFYGKKIWIGKLESNIVEF
jgi:hypothetical protein